MIASCPHISRRTSDSAFTLLETVVVIVILGIMATMIVPRVLDVGRRQAEIEARSVQRLLSIAAEKAAVWNQPVAVDFAGPASFGGDSDGGRLSVWSQREDPKGGADATGAARVKWQSDFMVEPVVLDRLRITQALQDGVVLGSSKWRIAFTPGQARPSVSIQLDPKSSGDGARWTVTLAPDESSATAYSGSDAPPAVFQSRTIDLDDSGKADAKW